VRLAAGGDTLRGRTVEVSEVNIIAARTARHFLIDPLSPQGLLTEFGVGCGWNSILLQLAAVFAKLIAWHTSKVTFHGLGSVLDERQSGSVRISAHSLRSSSLSPTTRPLPVRRCVSPPSPVAAAAAAAAVSRQVPASSVAMSPGRLHMRPRGRLATRTSSTPRQRVDLISKTA
jgi:hypothetical protein